MGRIHNWVIKTSTVSLVFTVFIYCIVGIFLDFLVLYVIFSNWLKASFYLRKTLIIVFLEKQMDYKDSINLPKTAFKMKASLPQKEPQMLKNWDETGLYEKIKSSRQSAEKFILHDGPPYANGNIHIGHALNKILKDIIIKCKTMEGFGTLYIPGWDCHGLPIEINVEKKLGKKKAGMSKVEIRENCREYR